MNLRHKFHSLAIFSLSLLAGLALPGAARAQCDLKITSCYICDANGNAYAPKVGDTYFVRVNWTVTGTPKAQYKVRFSIANQRHDWGMLPASPGSYYGYWGWTLPLDGTIPFKVTLDPANVTGDTNLANNVFSGKFIPVAPATAVEYFNPLTMNGTETFTVNWNTGGEVDHGFTLMGCPATDSYQVVDSASAPVGSQKVSTSPANDPVWQTNHGLFKPSPNNNRWADTTSFTVTCSSSRVNMTMLRAATWAELANLAPEYKVWTNADSWVQSNDPAIGAFVNSIIPASSLPNMKPYDAARKLYSAIVKRTIYTTPVSAFDALTVLNGKQGDCGGFSDLICACFRHIGIPSRTICGWWKGQDQWHCMAEFYLPGCGWVIADGSQCKVWFDPTGSYPYCFGAHTYLNEFCAVTRGTDHHTANFQVTELQCGWYYWWGSGASTGAITNSCSLQ